MENEILIEHILHAWHVHNRINLTLLEEIPPEGFGAVPIGSRGRTVTEQLVHMNNVRTGWLAYHKTGVRPKNPGVKGKKPSRAQLISSFRTSGKAVELFLRESLEGRVSVRMFTGNPMRWMGYLISHESHHRGSIMLALKQNGMRMPEKVSI